jgi:hypothetical protein
MYSYSWCAMISKPVSATTVLPFFKRDIENPFFPDLIFPTKRCYIPFVFFMADACQYSSLLHRI